MSSPLDNFAATALPPVPSPGMFQQPQLFAPQFRGLGTSFVDPMVMPMDPVMQALTGMSGQYFGAGMGMNVLYFVKKYIIFLGAAFQRQHRTLQKCTVACQRCADKKQKCEAKRPCQRCVFIDVSWNKYKLICSGACELI